MTADQQRKEGKGLAGYSPPLLRPKSRLQWLLFVAMNVLLFTGANMFWCYLRSGHWVDFTTASFHRNLTAPMGEVLLQPLSIFTHPWMIVVVGLMLGLLIAVPLVTAVMYQLLLSMVFVVIVGVIGHEPLLGLALAAGCLLAARSRLRREYPFPAALLGMVPVGIYLYLLTYAGIDAALLLPLQRWILAVPFLLAIAMSAVVMGAVVLMARLRRFQPGVVWPALLLFPAAAGVFYTQIGPAELSYALLSGSLAPGSVIFRPVARDEWVRREGAGLNEQTLPNYIRDDLERRKDELLNRCKAFLSRYPRSRRAAGVAWIRAQCESLQLETLGFEVKLLSYTAAFPLVRSAEEWRKLLEDYPSSDQTALGRWNLGMLKLREVGGIEDDTEVLKRAAQADKMLRAARGQLRLIVSDLRAQEQSDRTQTTGIFTQLSSLPMRQNYEQALFAAESLTWQIAENDVLKDPRCARAISLLLDANPFDHNYVRLLKQLAADEKYRKTMMADNLQMALAKLHRNPYDRAEAMIAIAADERTDAAIEANYELGRISMQTAQTPMISLVENMKVSEEYFEIVIAAPPNPWQERAGDNLKWLRSASARKKEP